MSPQQSIAHYRIVSKLGEGGMGAVYRATDTKLHRDVAIKVLPAALATDAQYMARFEREAQVLASLNHPNIAAIYGIEQGAIVMELVEGQDLKGPMDVEQALDIARQIAAGLAAAHDKGIVHRDLKPANLKITRGGGVKLLDFGLAKATEETAAGASATMSPTMSLAMTQAGVILGTAAYMSPEQARGKPVDQRSDIWAFGVVLYELLTGSVLFGGETITDILASVVRHEPELEKVPVQVRRLLRACLQREPQRRLQAIGDWALLLDQPAAAVAVTAPVKASSRVPWIAAGALLVGLGVLAAIHFAEKPPEAPVVRTSLLAPDGTSQEFTNGLGLPALSPDGKKIVFGAQTADGKNPLWVRSLDSLTAQPLAGTDGATFPFWSPDSRSIAFFADEKLKKIDAAGGAAIALTSAPKGTVRGGAWSPQGVIVFAPHGNNTARPMERVPAHGGTSADMPKATGRMPWFLPDGKHFLFSTLVGSIAEIRVASLDGGESRRIGAADTNAIYAEGRLLFLKDGALLAQPFDLQKLSLTGEAVPIAEDIESILNTATVGVFTAAANGILAYRTGMGGGMRTSMQLQWFDRSGKPGAALGPPGNLVGAHLSPDGTRAATGRAESGFTNRARDVWVYDVTRGAGTRFTSARAVDRNAVWSPDGSQIAFTSNREGNFDLYLKPSNGGSSEIPLLKSRASKYAEDWSPDGKFLLYSATDAAGNPNLFLLPLTGEDRQPRPYLRSEFVEVDGRFSPDGHWVAYTSNESGRFEVYVRPFPDSQGAKSLVSGGGGAGARWRRDGQELFYISADRKMMAVPVVPGAGFKVGPTVELFALPFSNQPSSQIRYDVTADGKRFLVVAQAAGKETAVPMLPTLTLIQNWTAGLKK